MTTTDMEQVTLTHSQIKYIMNLMMGDHHSSQSKLYNSLGSYLSDDMELERRAAQLEITVDQLYAQES